MMHPASDAASDDSRPNDRLAPRMALIGFLHFNIAIACMWGTFSVLLASVEARTGISRQASTLAVPAATLTSTLLAPVIGNLAARFSLRKMFLFGSLLSVCGYGLLAVSGSYAAYMVAYGALIGPGMTFSVVILPALLVTRWFNRHRGRALGFVFAPILVALMPLVATPVLQRYGLPGTYAMLCALCCLCVVASLFIRDHPPGQAVAETTATSGKGANGPGRQYLQLRFWTLALAAVAPMVSSIILTTHMVPMAQSWGMSARQGALLLSIQSTAGITGSVILGWIADRLGAVRTVALIGFNCMLVWIGLATAPPFWLAMVLIGICGLHLGGAVPVASLAIAEVFGRDNFGRLYGILQLINVPFSAACAPIAGLIYARTGSYSQALLLQAGFFALAVPLALYSRHKAAAAPLVAVAT